MKRIKRNQLVFKLFESLNREDIKYSVLRNYEYLPESCGTSDLDIIIALDDIFRFNHILSSLCEGDATLVSFTEDSCSPKVCMLTCKEGIQIDVFKGHVYYNSRILVNEQSVFRNTHTYNGISVLDDNFAVLIAFLKEILNNGKCCSKYLNPVLDNKKVYTTDYLRSNFSLLGTNFIQSLADSIQNETLSQDIPLLVKEGRQLFTKQGIGLNNYFFKLKRLFKQPGYTIAFLGTDGSGKSFIINSVTPILNEAFHNGIRYEHMRPNHLPSLAVLMGKKEKTDKPEVCSDPHGSKPAGFVGSLVRLSYYWLDYTWGYFRKVFLDKAFKTHLWIFDRYYYDYIVDPLRARLSLPSWIIKLYGFFVPTPDLIICLGGDPNKIYARKPETSLEEVKRQTQVLQKFCNSHEKAVWVDTTVAPEESIHNAMQAVQKMMSVRFKAIK